MILLKKSVEQFEREAITNALNESNWVMARAARNLGITERMIGYKIKKYRIKRGEERRESGNGSESLPTTVKQA